MENKPTKRFFRKWRKRNGEGCTYGLIDGGCDCAGPMACEHGEKGKSRLNADSLRLHQDDAERGMGSTTTSATYVPYATTANGYAKFATQTNLPLVHTAALAKAKKKNGKWWNASASKVVCTHDGTKMLFKINDSEIYATTVFQARRMKDAALVLQCTEDMFSHGEDDGFSLPKKYENLREHLVIQKHPPTIILPWADYSLPPVFMSFWPALVDSLPKGKVIVACVGSHGRTGTTLAALLITHKHMTAEDAIAYVRTVHCDSAIESKQQEGYLHALARMQGIEDGTEETASVTNLV